MTSEKPGVILVEKINTRTGERSFIYCDEPQLPGYIYIGIPNQKMKEALNPFEEAFEEIQRLRDNRFDRRIIAKVKKLLSGNS